MTVAIIVNADDLGRSVSVNDAVFALIRQKKVTSASIIAAGEGLKDVSARCRQNTDCSFGVHLYLDEFPPITRMLKAPHLVNQDGRFKNDITMWRLTRNVKEAIAEEWIGQIRSLQVMGIPVTHIDSHHHVHTIPALFGVLKQVQRHTGIRKVRISLNCCARSISLLFLLKKKLFNSVLKYYVSTVTTSHFTSFAIFLTLLRSKALPRLSTIELMVHPGAATYMENPVEYEQELTNLKQDWTAELPWDYRLISYNDL